MVLANQVLRPATTMKLLFFGTALLLVVSAKKKFFCSDKVCVICDQNLLRDSTVENSAKPNNCPSTTLGSKPDICPTCEDATLLCDKGSKFQKTFRKWTNNLSKAAKAVGLANRSTGQIGIPQKKEHIASWKAATGAIKNAFEPLSKYVCSNELEYNATKAAIDAGGFCHTSDTTRSCSRIPETIWSTVRDTLLAPILDACADSCALIISMLEGSFPGYYVDLTAQILNRNGQIIYLYNLYKPRTISFSRLHSEGQRLAVKIIFARGRKACVLPDEIRKVNHPCRGRKACIRPLTNTKACPWLPQAID